MADTKLVKLWPVPGRYILGVSTAPEGIEVEEAEARRLLKYDPPVFTDQPPKPVKAEKAEEK